MRAKQVAVLAARPVVVVDMPLLLDPTFRTELFAARGAEVVPRFHLAYSTAMFEVLLVQARAASEPPPGWSNWRQVIAAALGPGWVGDPGPGDETLAQVASAARADVVVTDTQRCPAPWLTLTAREFLGAMNSVWNACGHPEIEVAAR